MAEGQGGQAALALPSSTIISAEAGTSPSLWPFPPHFEPPALMAIGIAPAEEASMRAARSP